MNRLILTITLTITFLLLTGCNGNPNIFKNLETHKETLTPEIATVTSKYIKEEEEYTDTYTTMTMVGKVAVSQTHYETKIRPAEYYLLFTRDDIQYKAPVDVETYFTIETGEDIIVVENLVTNGHGEFKRIEFKYVGK